jgi:hypothetical protein
VGDGGLINASGDATGINLYTATLEGTPSFESSQTDPESYFWTWTGSDEYWAAVRDRIVGSFEVIAFKQCFVSVNIDSADELQQRKDWYLAMRDFFDKHPERLFVVISPPPKLPVTLYPISSEEGATVEQAHNARLFANWLKSSAYLSGHPNVVCFDLFDRVANPDNGSAEANTLRDDYRRPIPTDPPDLPDPHPNETANLTMGPIFARFLIDAALNY